MSHVLTSPSLLLSGPISLSGSRSLSRKRSTTSSPSVEGHHTGLEKQKDQKSEGGDSVMSACPEDLEFVSEDTQDNMERQAKAGRWRNT